MPIITMFDSMRWPRGDGHSPYESRATRNCATISPASRLRTMRWVPVWQKVHDSVQPTCEEMQSAPRSSSGM